MLNRQVVLVRRPVGQATEECLALQDAPMPEPAEGDVAVATRYLSVDPYLRGRMEGDVGYAGGSRSATRSRHVPSAR